MVSSLKKKYIGVLLFVVVIFGCQTNTDNDDDKITGDCQNAIIFDMALFGQLTPDGFNIVHAEINGDCLMVSVASSGCDGTTWQAQLVTDGLQTNAIPPSRRLRLNFTNFEDCDAALVKDYQFDLGDEIQTVIYGLDNWNGGSLIHNG